MEDKNIIKSDIGITADHVSQDYNEVRDNLKEIISVSKGAAKDLVQVATETNSPRAYEVLSGLIQTTLEANQKLMELHKTVKILKGEKGSSKNVTNNSIFVGSTKDLLDMIKNKKAGKELEIITPPELEQNG